MRLWSLHPSYLNRKQLAALWREGLLVKEILAEETKIFRNYPQLIRFRALKYPIAAINQYLEAVYDESKKRGYAFSKKRFSVVLCIEKINVTQGQLNHEWKLLNNKISGIKQNIEVIIPHPLFKVIPGKVESWEKLSNNPHAFPYQLDYRKLDFRKNPELYRVGKGEQGVLLVEPYKSEILPFWRFKTKIIAKQSASKIYDLFLEYKRKNDFIGMDMARKFLQMGYTRSRRYANHPSGRKYKVNPQNYISKIDEKKARLNQLPRALDFKENEKAESAKIFYTYYQKVMLDEFYLIQKKVWLLNEEVLL